MNDQLRDKRLLIVDDNATNVELVEQLLDQHGYTAVLSTTDPSGVLDLCTAWKPDLVLLDLHMPQMSGFEVMAQLRELMGDPENLPVLVLTADGTVDARHRALEMGAQDFITKPLDGRELLLRTHNLLHTRHLQSQLRRQNESLDEAVKKRTHELDQARIESLTMLAAVGEFHDEHTYEHTRRVGVTAARLAETLDLGPAFVADIRSAAPLHDIGKIAVPRQILRKPGPLTAEERENMERHADVGAQILSSAVSPVLRMAAEIAASHHENWDGSGYPRGLRGEEIPLAGRITAVADVFDALSHERPYKPAWSVEDAVAEITSQAAGKFDPRIVDAFRALEIQSIADFEKV